MPVAPTFALSTSAAPSSRLVIVTVTEASVGLSRSVRVASKSAIAHASPALGERPHVVGAERPRTVVGVQVEHRRVVDGADGDADGRGGGLAVRRPGPGTWKLAAPVKSSVGVKVKLPSLSEHDRSADRRADDGQRQRTIADAGVVRKHARRGEHERGVLGGGVGVVVGDRDVVDRGDGHVDGGGGGAAVAVADGVGERVGAEEVGVRGVGHGGATDDRDRPVGALGDAGDGQRLADVGRDGVVASTLIVLAPESSATVATSSLATGGSLTAVTVTLTVAVAVPPLPSLMV